MSIPFSPTRADSQPEDAEEHISSEEQDEYLVSAGGDGAPEIVLDDVREGGPSSAPASGEEVSPEDVSSVEQIRDILFGRQMSAYEERFSKLEQRMLETTEALRQEIKERLDSLDAYVKEETAGLGRRITQERDVRNVAVEELVTSIRRHRDSLGKRIQGVEEAANEGGEALRSQVLSEAKRAQEALETRTDDLRKTLDENVAALGDRKADRHALATLLADMAARLSEGNSEA